jgi:hypothetical protein
MLHLGLRQGETATRASDLQFVPPFVPQGLQEAIFSTVILEADTIGHSRRELLYLI